MATKRSYDETIDIDPEHLEKIVEAVTSALKKPKAIKNSDATEKRKSWFDIFNFGMQRGAMSDDILNIAGEFIHNGTIYQSTVVAQGPVIQYWFEVKYPNSLSVDILKALNSIRHIVRTQIETVKNKPGFMKVILTYTKDTKLEMRFRKDDETSRSQPSIEREIKGTEMFKAIKQHMKTNVQVDETEDCVLKGEKNLADGIILVSIAQSILTPVRFEQLERLRAHSLIQHVQVTPHPNAEKVRVGIDLLKEQ